MLIAENIALTNQPVVLGKTICCKRDIKSSAYHSQGLATALRLGVVMMMCKKDRYRLVSY